VVCAGLPIERVAPTAFQRDLSPAHARRLEEVIVRIGRFLDPVIAVPGDAGYLVPNGHHRLEAMRALGARAIVALVVPESKVAYQILALNTEKAHNVKEKALEVVRMAQELARLDPRAEAEFALEFEEPALLTLGLAYAERPRFAGGAYGAVLRRVEEFLPLALPAALERRRGRAAALLRLDDAVSEVVARLKERGLDSPYLKAFVVARIHPARFHRGAARPDPDGTLAQMTGAAVGFDVARVRPEQLAATAPIGDG
jgi:ParB family chromosome partitioning protein